MPAYVRRTLYQFIHDDAATILGNLQQAYSVDGFASQYTRQTRAWAQIIPKLQTVLCRLLAVRPEANEWSALLEYPLYRLRRRIDIVILAGCVVVVVECKVGADAFTAEDRRQVEEYALDLRDFHAESRHRSIIPVLWSTETRSSDGAQAFPTIVPRAGTVADVIDVNAEGLQSCLATLSLPSGENIVADKWDRSAYKPVPSVIEAATSIFAGHDVRAIANADADNLRLAAVRLLELIEEARSRRRRYLLLLTGVPGSGKTLAGLHVVHSAVTTGVESKGDIVYLSGNTPLVIVLREALAQDEDRRRQAAGEKRHLKDIRRELKTRIQHINDFLTQHLRTPEHAPPEHVIVFDEAQRAWDEKHGLEKFERTASEPSLLLELMSRHADWCACVCLIGGGQEINSGENGVLGWGDALRRLQSADRRRWTVLAPPDVLGGGPNAGTFTLGDLPSDLETTVDGNLQLCVPQRSYRSPSLCRWVDCVLAGDAVAARTAAEELHEYPILIMRSLAHAKASLREWGRGERRYGLVASSGARRLRAEGLGLLLDATAGNEIAQWYLKPHGDIRSSYALEVPANEYTCQGLELDFVCVCWGGDFLWSDAERCWQFSRLNGTNWNRIRHDGDQRFLLNSYRVLLTRAREGLVLWVPQGEASDLTRPSGPLDATAQYLVRCGARLIDVNSNHTDLSVAGA